MRFIIHLNWNFKKCNSPVTVNYVATVDKAAFPFIGNTWNCKDNYDNFFSVSHFIAIYDHKNIN